MKASLLKRAITTLTRKPKQSFLLFFIFFLTAYLLYSSFSIARTMSFLQKNILSRIPPVVFIWSDDEAQIEYFIKNGYFPSRQAINYELINELSQLPYVYKSQLHFRQILYSRELDLIWDPSWGNNYSSHRFWGSPIFESFEIMGVNSPHFMELDNEVIRISSGRNFSAEEIDNNVPVALVSTTFATMNNLIVGDEIYLESVVLNRYGTMSDGYIDSKRIPFEIIGLYQLTMPIDQERITDRNGAAEWESFNFLNRIFLPSSILEEMILFDIYGQREYLFQGGDLGPYWTLYDVEELLSTDIMADRKQYFLILYNSSYLSSFHDSSQDILPEFVIGHDLSHGFHNEIVATEQIRSISNFLSFLLIGGSIFILSLTIILVINERKKEVGVYLSLGESKVKTYSQFILEISLIAIVAGGLAVSVGIFSTDSLARTLLVNEISSLQVSQEEPLFHYHREIYWFAPPASSPTDFVASFENIRLETNDLFLYGAMLGTTVIFSIFISLSYFLKLNPKKLLIN